MYGNKENTWIKTFSKAWYVLIATCWLLMHVTPLQATGEPEIWKYRTPDIVESGDPVTITIRVEGYSGVVPEPIPFDGVLLIDMSDSIDDSPPHSDPQDHRLDAAISFVKCVAPQTRLALVTFSSEAALKQGLTTDQILLESKIDQLRGQADGGTNIYDAMDMAQDILTTQALPDRERFIILLTDGSDNSHTDLEFLNLAQTAAQNSIVYFTIALGSEADYGLLYMIADITEGEAFPSTSPTELGGLYTDICHSTSTQARTRNIVLHEKVNIAGQPSVLVVPGTFSSSVAGINPELIQQFEQIGQINVSMGSLASGEEETITFQVTSDCLTPEAEPGAQVDVNIDQSSSHVTYTYGLSDGNKHVPQASFTCQAPGDIAVDKEFDPGTMELKVTVENKWSEDLDGNRDNSLTNVVVIEKPSFYFQPNPKFTVPPVDYLLPSNQADALIWRIPKLAPKEKIELSTKLDSRVCSANYQPPIDVDAEKYTGGGSESVVIYNTPTGEQKSLSIPNKTTTLSLVEQCDGRHDINVRPAYSLGEFKSDIGLLPPVPFIPRSVLPRHESPSIWVDSEYGNGLWDGITDNVEDFIEGATLQYYARVQGQGDLFTTTVKNNIYTYVGNSGTVPSVQQSSGLKLLIYNHSLQHWDQRGAAILAPIASEKGALLHIPLAPNSITPEYIQPYRLELKDVLAFIHLRDRATWGRLKSWLNAHPVIKTSLINLGGLVPNDISNVLPDPCDCAWYDFLCRWQCRSTNDANIRNAFDRFLERYPDIAWGKPSIQVRLTVNIVEPERHTHNNLASEVVILRE